MIYQRYKSHMKTPNEIKKESYEMLLVKCQVNVFTHTF